MLSNILIASGLITYVGCWLVVIFIILIYQPDPFVRAGLITYAALPIGAICQSGIGYLLAGIGL
jgi:hypothetical protein